MSDCVDAIYQGIDPETGKRFEDLTDEEFLDCCSCVKCSDCCNSIRCSNFSNGRLEFARPWFACCSDGPVCKDFYPTYVHRWLIKYWRGVNVFTKNKKPDDKVAFFLDGNTDIAYYCLYKDFFNGDLWDEDGNLKWVSRSYYKQSRKSPFGYIFVKEQRILNEQD